jgi:hypothetical protein
MLERVPAILENEYTVVSGKERRRICGPSRRKECRIDFVAIVVI